MLPLDELAKRLAELERALEPRAWADDGVRLLGEAGCWRAVVPKRFGGDALGVIDQMRVYETVATGSVSLALVLTQHDRACELVAMSGNEPLAEALLPRVVTGDLLATVGISQLTTSKRGKGPPMRAEQTADGFALTGLMPWVTSAAKANVIVTGAVLPDVQQILACIPTESAGVEIGEPMRLMALERSWTSEVRCDGAPVTARELLRGPADQVLAARAPVKSFVVTSVGIGLAGALHAAIQETAARQPAVLEPVAAAVSKRYHDARDRLFAAGDRAAAAEVDTAETTAIRADINDLLHRLAATALTLAKGSGFVAGHPTQRLVREAMFFLVWSAPDTIRTETLQRLWS